VIKIRKFALSIFFFYYHACPTPSNELNEKNTKTATKNKKKTKKKKTSKKNQKTKKITQKNKVCTTIFHADVIKSGFF